MSAKLPPFGAADGCSPVTGQGTSIRLICALMPPGANERDVGHLSDLPQAAKSWPVVSRQSWVIFRCCTSASMIGCPAPLCPRSAPGSLSASEQGRNSVEGKLQCSDAASAPQTRLVLVSSRRGLSRPVRHLASGISDSSPPPVRAGASCCRHGRRSHPGARCAAGLPAGASRRLERHDEHLYCFAGRKRNADQVSSIDTWRTGCTPWPTRAATSRSRLRSVPSWPPLG